MRAITIKKSILLVTIDRRCLFPRCQTRISIGLTQDEARNYTGFECENCKQWNEDSLSERDVPEWWDELNPSSNIS